MLSEIYADNFKSLKDIRVDIGRITVLTGPNGGGKSSLLQSLLLLNQSKNGKNMQFGGNQINLIDFNNVIYNDLKAEEITISFAGKDKVASEGLISRKEFVDIEFDISLGVKISGLENLYGSFYFKDRDINLEIKNRRSESGEFRFEVDRGSTILLMPQINFYTPFSVAGFEGTVVHQTEWANFLGRISSTPGRILSRIEYIPANRGFNSPVYKLGPQADYYYSTEKTTEKYENGIASTFAYKRDLLEPILRDWFKQITGIVLKAPLASDNMVNIVASPHVKNPTSQHNQVNVTFEGLGSNQLIFILLPLALAEPGSIMLIEEPELHLHPAAQAQLTRVLVRECYERDIQLIFTTQSDHILSALLTCIAEDNRILRDISMWYFHKKRTRVHAEKLKVDRQGRVKGGLPGFFEARMKEMSFYIEALEKKTR